MMKLSSLKWHNHRLAILDQRLLPEEIRYLQPRGYLDVVQAIRTLAVRGAPLIGVAAAFGLAQEAFRKPGRRHLLRAAQVLKTARPTAANLALAIGRLEAIIQDHMHPESVLAVRLEQAARTIEDEEKARSERIAGFGARLIRNRFRILTICNAGRLAAPGMGTTLAPVYRAQRLGKRIQVFVPETRPLLQGSRLTAFELHEAGIPCTVLADSMVATILPDIDLVLVGADRIARNGDTANKVGTYQMALLARRFGKPFYPVAPVSTFDFQARTGKDIPIEQRDPQELEFCAGRRIAPDGVKFLNPAFDVTPARLLSGIITDQGILLPPLKPAIARLRRKP